MGQSERIPLRTFSNINTKYINQSLLLDLLGVGGRVGKMKHKSPIFLPFTDLQNGKKITSTRLPQKVSLESIKSL